MINDEGCRSCSDMQCRVSVLRCIEQRFLYNFVFGTQAAQLCRFVDSEALNVAAWCVPWWFAVLINWFAKCEGDHWKDCNISAPGLFQLQGALCRWPQHQESTWRAGNLWEPLSFVMLMANPTEITARRMDWWEHVRRCRRRAQARPVTWPRKWQPRLWELPGDIQNRSNFVSFVASHQPVDRLRCLPFQFRPCCFHHLSDTRQLIILLFLRGQRTRESSWALNGSPVQARLESSIIKVASVASNCILSWVRSTF